MSDREEMMKFVGLTATIAASYAFVSGMLIANIAPETFPLIWQHVFEITALAGGLMVGVFTTEEYYGNIYDNQQIALIGGLMLGISLFTVPWIPWENLDAPRIISLGILAAFETVLVLYSAVGFDYLFE